MILRRDCPDHVGLWVRLLGLVLTVNCGKNHHFSGWALNGIRMVRTGWGEPASKHKSTYSHCLCPSLWTWCFTFLPWRLHNHGLLRGRVSQINSTSLVWLFVRVLVATEIKLEYHAYKLTNLFHWRDAGKRHEIHIRDKRWLEPAHPASMIVSSGCHSYRVKRSLGS